MQVVGRIFYTKFKLTLGIVTYGWQNKKFVNKTKIKTDIFSIIFTVFEKKYRKNINCRVAMTTMYKYFMFPTYSCIFG